MSLSARAIAVQGAGFGPRLLAVQGFAAVAVQADRYGGGGRRVESDEDLRRLVEAKWETIEAARLADALVPTERALPAAPAAEPAELPLAIAAATPIVLAPVRAAAADIAAPALLPDAAERARQARRRADEDALILLLLSS